MRTSLFGFGFIAILLLTSTLFAQGANVDSIALRQWKIGVENSLGVTQAAFSDNWTGGEAGSVIWVANVAATADRMVSPSLLFGNELKLAFGQTHSQDEVNKKWSSPKKSTDRVRYDTILRILRGWAVDPFASGNLESQFYDASGLEKRYLNPLELTEAVGVAKYISNVPDVRVISTRLGAALKQRFATFDDTANVGQTIDENTNSGGLEWVTDVAFGSAKSRFSFNSKLTVYQALVNSEAEEGFDNWKAADVNWDNTLRANVTRILQVSLSWQHLYDKEIDLGGRFKETLALGVSYNFSNYQR